MIDNECWLSNRVEERKEGKEGRREEGYQLLCLGRRGESSPRYWEPGGVVLGDNKLPRKGDLAGQSRLFSESHT